MGSKLQIPGTIPRNEHTHTQSAQYYMPTLVMASCPLCLQVCTQQQPQGVSHPMRCITPCTRDALSLPNVSSRSHRVHYDCSVSYCATPKELYHADRHCTIQIILYHVSHPPSAVPPYTLYNTYHHNPIWAIRRHGNTAAQVSRPGIEDPNVKPRSERL